MTELASDDFNRPNEALTGNWTKIGTQTLSIVSNAVPTAGLPDDGAYVWNAVVWPDDQYAQLTFTAGSGATSDAGPGVMLRCDGTTANLFRIVCNATQIDIRQIKSSVTSAITTRPALVDGDILRVEIQGVTMKVFVNNVQSGADITTDGVLATGSAGLFYSSGANFVIDDFKGGDFGAGPVDTTTRRFQIRHSRMTSW